MCLPPTFMSLLIVSLFCQSFAQGTLTAVLPSRAVNADEGGSFFPFDPAAHFQAVYTASALAPVMPFGGTITQI